MRDNDLRKSHRPLPIILSGAPGNVVDFRAVEDILRELCERFEVLEIAFDPHLARKMLNNLLEDGYPAIETRQEWVTVAPAIKELERAIVGRKFQHGAGIGEPRDRRGHD